MRLSDVVSHSGLAGYAVVGMILFLAAFIAIVLRTFWPSRREAIERQGRLPLGDEPGEPPSEPKNGGARP